MGFFDFLKTAEHDVGKVANTGFNFLKATSPAYNIFKSIEGIAGNKQAGDESMKNLGNLVHPVTRAIPETALTLAHPFTQHTSGAPTTNIEKAIFGEQPVQNVQKKVANTYTSQGGGIKGAALATAEGAWSFLQDAPVVAGAATGAKEAIAGFPETAAAIRASEVGSIGKDVTNAIHINTPLGTLRVGSDEMNALSHATSVGDVKKIIGKSLPQNVVDKVAPAIANSKDPNVISNIFTRALSPTRPTIPSDITPPPSTPINDLTNPVGQGTSVTSEVTPVTPTTSAPLPDTPVNRVINALRGQPAAPGQSPVTGINNLNRQQKALYTSERSARLGAAQNTGDLTGRAATYSQLGALKGALPKVDSTALVEHLKSIVSPNDVNGILDTLRTHPNLSGYEPITAQNSIVKLFDEGKLPTEGEFKILQKALGSDFTDTLKTTAVDSMSNWEKVKNFGTQLLGMPKSVMASFDLSGGGRQGAVLGSRFLPEWGIAQKSAVKAFASETYYTQRLSEIAASNTAKWYDDIGINIASKGAHEEAFASNLAETPIKVGGKNINLPGRGVAASDRAYTLGLTEQRTGVADHIYNDLKDAGIDPYSLSSKAKKDIGKFINTASGRGDLGSLEKYAQSLGEALFSPRLWKSRLDMLNPVYYAKLDPIARKYALQSAGSFASIAATVISLAALAGAKVETDPRSSDFLKIRIGDTRYDVLGGFQQNLVLAAREISGEKKNSTTGVISPLNSGKFGAANRLSILSDFIQNKENPVISTGQRILAGTDKSGNPVNPATEIGKLFVPLNLQDTYAAAKNTGNIPEGILKATIPGTIGIGVGTYGLKDIQPSKKQQAYIKQLKSQGASSEQITATTSFYQHLKATPNKQQYSDNINKALSKGDYQKAIQLSKDYNQKYAAAFKDWVKQYSQYSNSTLVQDYNSGKLNLTSSDINTRLNNINSNPLYSATLGG